MSGGGRVVGGRGVDDWGLIVRSLGVLVLVREHVVHLVRVVAWKRNVD